MQIAVLGTGLAGRTLAAALQAAGHHVVVGTRDPQASLARTEPDSRGTPGFGQWAGEHPDIGVVTQAEAGGYGEVLINATSGEGTLAAVGAAAPPPGTVLLDVSNALDFSAGFPPVLSVANTDSLGEQLQRAFPDVRVVKSLNTVNAAVMVDPATVPGEHHIFVAGEDADAKAVVTRLLGDLGWPATSVLDLGGIRSARATEMYLPLWLALMGAAGSPVFNIRVVTP
jgi:predicted dinucleotide-binding enzyme